MKWTVKRQDLSFYLNVSGIFACLMPEGREFQDLAPKKENERSPLVLLLNFGTLIMRVSSEERRDLDERCRCKRSER